MWDQHNKGASKRVRKHANGNCLNEKSKELVFLHSTHSNDACSRKKLRRQRRPKNTNFFTLLNNFLRLLLFEQEALVIDVTGLVCCLIWIQNSRPIKSTKFGNNCWRSNKTKPQWPFTITRCRTGVNYYDMNEIGHSSFNEVHLTELILGPLWGMQYFICNNVFHLNPVDDVME